MIEIDDLDRNWLKTDMVAAIEPMDDRGYEIASEAHKLPMGKVLDVFADRFATFAVLNPSLLTALRLCSLGPIPQSRSIGEVRR